MVMINSDNTCQFHYQNKQNNFQHGPGSQLRHQFVLLFTPEQRQPTDYAGTGHVH